MPPKQYVELSNWSDDPSSEESRPSNKRKKSNNNDGSNPKSAVRAKTTGRPRKEDEYVFDELEIEQIKRKLKAYGNSFAIICGELYPPPSPVTRQMIQKLVTTNPNLKQFAAEAHKNLKDKSKDSFVNRVPTARSNEQKPEEKPEISQDIDFFNMTFFESKTAYSWVFRHDLASEVDVEFSKDRKNLVCAVIAQPLLPQERSMLSIHKSLKPEQNFDQVYQYKTKMQRRNLLIKIPDDGNTSSFVRDDLDTPFGCLCEIVLQRIAEVDPLCLKPKKYKNIAIMAASTVPLAQREIDENAAGNAAGNDNLNMDAEG